MNSADLLQKSHVRWFIVGCSTAVIDTTLFLVTFHFTDKAVVSNLLSGTIATCFNYVAHYRWSFTSNREHVQSTFFYLTFLFFFLFLNTTLIKYLLSQSVPPFFAKTGTAAATAPMSFLIMKFLTFRRNNHD